jgi:hypothetical protein
MKIKPLVLKVAVPFLEKYGFHLHDSCTGYYEFKSNDEKKFIVFDISNLGRGFRVSFKIVSDNMYVYKDFTPHSINPYEFPSDFKRYANEEEFEDILRKYLQITKEHAIPIFDKISKPLPGLTDKMYKKLEDDVVQKAIDFSKFHNLPIEYSVATMEYLEKYLDFLKSGNGNLAELFETSEEKIINMSAYLGESILTVKPGGKWIGGKSEFNNALYYRVKMPSKGPTEFDALNDIRACWVDCPEITTSRLTYKCRFRLERNFV